MFICAIKSSLSLPLRDVCALSVIYRFTRMKILRDRLYRRLWPERRRPFEHRYRAEQAHGAPGLVCMSALGLEVDGRDNG